MWPGRVAFTMAVIRPLLWIMGPVIIEDPYPENINYRGLIVAAPHRTNWDVLVLQSVVKRQIRFCAKKPLFEMPIVKWLVNFYQAFPVEQNKPDRAALRTAIGLVEDKKVVCFFPEGKIQTTPNVEADSLKPGMSYIIRRTGCPVLGVSIQGLTRPWYKRQPIRVRYRLFQYKRDTDQSRQVLTDFATFVNERGT